MEPRDSRGDVWASLGQKGEEDREGVPAREAGLSGLPAERVKTFTHVRKAIETKSSLPARQAGVSEHCSRQARAGALSRSVA